MTEEVQMALAEAEAQMKKAIEHLDNELTKIRAGKAHPTMLDMVKVDYYGSFMPIKQVANVTTPDARTITIQPWEKAMINPICEAVMNANLGLNPQNNGELVIINVPALTEERRRDLTKRAKADGEHAKVSLRTARKDANDFLKEAEKEGLPEDEAKRAEAKIQELTNAYSLKIDAIIAEKEKDIMTV